uniref:uncharacterized protein LOC131125924 n=1 Tax=Doryrhamphus excisus TaxID=161450 RepID=UPI0025AEC857|nr:uncharacterized protein LOC131125924 [Doryrhamphus excisus]
MLLVNRLLCVFVLVCAAVVSLVMCSRPARASPVRVQAVKRPLYSAYSSYLLPSPGRQSKQEALNLNSKPETSGPTDGFFSSVSQYRGQSQNMYPAFIRKQAPLIASQHSYQSSKNPTEDTYEDGSRRAQSGGRTVWQTLSRVSFQTGRYTTSSLPVPGGHYSDPKDTEELASSGSQTDTWRPKKVHSFLFKNLQPSFVAQTLGTDPAMANRRPDKGVRLYRPSLEQSNSNEEHVALLAPIQHISGVGTGTPLQSVLPPVAHFQRSNATGGKTSSSSIAVPNRSISSSKGVFKHSHWATSMAFPSFSPANKGQRHTFKITNVYPLLSSKYSFSQRRVTPVPVPRNTTDPPSVSGSQQAKNQDHRFLRDYKKKQGLKTLGFPPLSTFKPADVAKVASSYKSVVQQIFDGLEENLSQLRHPNISKTPNPKEQNETNRKEMQIENQKAALSSALSRVVASAYITPAGGATVADKTARLRPNGTLGKPVERKARLLGSFTSNTVRGIRVGANYTKHSNIPIVQNSPIVRRPKKPGYASGTVSLESITPTTQTSTTELALSHDGPLATSSWLFEGVMHSRDNTSQETTVGPNKEKEGDIKTWPPFNNTKLFNVSDSLEAESEAREEDLLQLHYLRISTKNISFKSMYDLEK